MRQQERRGSRHQRGYDYEWTKAAAAFIKRFPICQECERAEIIVPAQVVDHKIPVKARPDLRMEKRNWWCLCHDCHNGMKRRMEAYAASAGKIDLLLDWCDDPSSRPAALRGAPKRPKKGLMV